VFGHGDHLSCHREPPFPFASCFPDDSPKERMTVLSFPTPKVREQAESRGENWACEELGCRVAPAGRPRDAKATRQSFGSYRIMLQVRQRLADGCIHKSTVPFYFAQEHSTLDHGDAKVCHGVLVGCLDKSAFGLFFPEVRSNLVAYDFKNEAEILP